MNQFSYQASDNTLEKIAYLAKWWGFPPQRHNTAIIRKLVDEAYATEKARRELAELDQAINNEPDPLA